MTAQLPTEMSTPVPPEGIPAESSMSQDCAAAPKPSHRPQPLQLRASKLAAELQRLSGRAREELGVADEVLVVMDAVVMFAQAIVDEDDRRPWVTKLEEVFDAFAEVGQRTGPAIAAFLADLDQVAIEGLVRRHAREGYVSYVRKMIGSAAFHRLHVAVSEDADLLAAAGYKGVEAIMPYAVAIADLAEMLTEQQIRAFMDFNPAGGFMLDMAVKLLELLDVAVQKIALPEHVAQVVRAREEGPNRDDLIELTLHIRERVSGSSRAWVKEVSAVLDRKLQGARDALAYSADSVSQAANSLIEFIDRLLRDLFTEDEVLGWLEENYVDVHELTYLTGDGRLRPTKRGQALCLTHGRQPVATPSPLNLLAATSLNSVRKRLQVLKHADQGTPEERAEIDECMQGVEAFVHTGCRMAWALLPDAALAELRSRLEPRASSQVVRGEIA